jgi:tripartite-type tricarboxylate transporter receptor subunit TctC
MRLSVELNRAERRLTVANAQKYPNRPIRLIEPVAVGGSVDPILRRALAVRKFFAFVPKFIGA